MDQDVEFALADVRMQLGQLRSALGVQTPDQAEAAVLSLRQSVEGLSGTGPDISALQGSVSSLNGSVSSLNGSVSSLNGSVTGIEQGGPWQPLTMPSGASGDALYRAHAGGLLALQLALSWRSAPGSVALSGVPVDLQPARPWSDGTVSVALNGLVTLNVTGTQFSASVLVPLK